MQLHNCETVTEMELPKNRRLHERPVFPYLREPDLFAVHCECTVVMNHDPHQLSVLIEVHGASHLQLHKVHEEWPSATEPF